MMQLNDIQCLRRSPATQNPLAQNCNSAEIEKPCLREKPHAGTLCLLFHFTSSTAIMQSWFSFLPIGRHWKRGHKRFSCLLQAPWPQSISRELNTSLLSLPHTPFPELEMIWQMKTSRFNLREIRYPKPLSCYQKRGPRNNSEK